MNLEIGTRVNIFGEPKIPGVITGFGSLHNKFMYVVTLDEGDGCPGERCL